MTAVEQQQSAAEQERLQAWLSGPSRTRYSALPPQVGDPAPELELPDTSGRKRRLSDFWQAKPALILFLRHFGCSCLAERWDQLKGDLGAFAVAGAQVVAICQGEPESTAALATRRGYPFPLLFDPDRRAYHLFGLLVGAPAQILSDFYWNTQYAEYGMMIL